MDCKLMERLQVVTPEEHKYLQGNTGVEKGLYTSDTDFKIDRRFFLKTGKLVTVRRHSRFVSFPLHQHNYIEIVYVCRGTLTNMIDGKHFRMEKGDILFLSPNARHAVEKAGHEDIAINFITLPEFFHLPLEMLHAKNVIAEFLVDALCSREPMPHYLLFHLKDSAAVDNLMENMIVSLLDNTPDMDVINQYTMGLVFLHLLNHLDALEKNSSQTYEDIIIQSAMRYIDCNYRKASFAQIAGELHQSPSALSRMIKKETGCTFQELLQRKRFQKAVFFLEDSKMPVSEIAAAVGYENFSYFYRTFKMRFGMTPREYRVRNQRA